MIRIDRRDEFQGVYKLLKAFIGSYQILAPGERGEA